MLSISFRIDWCNLLAVQGILKSLLQCHRSKTSVLWHNTLAYANDTVTDVMTFLRLIIKGQKVGGGLIFRNRCSFPHITGIILPLIVVCLVAQSSNSLQPHGVWPTRLLCPCNSPGKNIGLGCHFLLQGIFLTQGSNLGLLYCRRMLYCLSYKGRLWNYPTHKN